MPMPTVTAQDLQDWSPRLDARAHLPTLIRRLIFASVRPDQIVVPDAEGTCFPGLDGIQFSAAGALPYVPAGRSAWEFKTSGVPQTELAKDYRKRTKQLTAAERATTTIVLVTTRIWDRTSVDKWITRRVKDGWADIKVNNAEEPRDLAVPVRWGPRMARRDDSEIEIGLWSGRMKSRGVTSRNPHIGGQQERDTRGRGRAIENSRWSRRSCPGCQRPSNSLAGEV
jgi:hypothetical protein